MAEVFDVRYNITYNGQGGQNVPSTTSGWMYGVAYGSTFVAYISGTVPTRTGYTFLGWSESMGATTAQYQPNDSVTFQATASTVTKALYAVWRAKTYTVSYNKGSNGSGTNTTATKTYDVDLTLRGATFTRTGYDQDGWSTTDGGSLVYALGGTYSANAAVTLYPHWRAKTYTVSYNKGSNGSGTNTTATKTYDVDLTLRGATFTRTGYDQDGWSTTDGGSLAYALGGTYSANAAVTLYPHWKPMQSVISSVTSSVPADGTTTGTVNITRYNSAYTHKVTVILGSRSQTFDDVGTSKSFTIPSSWLDQIPTATSKAATVTVTTWSGNTQIGVADSKTFTVTVPSTVKPTVSLSAVNKSDNSVVSGWDTLIQGFSKIKLTASASAGSGSSISSIVFSGDSVSQSGTDTTVTSSILTNAGSRKWKVIVTDARGRTASATVTRTVHEYFPASIISLTAKRSGSSGTDAPADGTYINAKGTYVFASCNGHNSATVKKIEYKRHTVSSWSMGVSSASSGTAYTFGSGAISILYNYDVRLTVTDALGSTASYVVNVSSVIGFAFGLNGQCARFGGPVQYDDRFECDFNAQFNKVVDIVQRRADASL